MYMQTPEGATPLYDFRKDFDSIARPGLDRFLGTSAELLGDAFDGERRAGYANGYVRSLWRTLKSEQEDAEFREGVEPAPPIGEPEAPIYIPPTWDAERAAIIAAELEADVTDSERRAAADPRSTRPHGGGEAYDRAMVREAPGLHDLADQQLWGDEAIAAFLPMPRRRAAAKTMTRRWTIISTVWHGLSFGDSSKPRRTTRQWSRSITSLRRGPTNPQGSLSSPLRSTTCRWGGASTGPRRTAFWAP